MIAGYMCSRPSGVGWRLICSCNIGKTGPTDTVSIPVAEPDWAELESIPVGKYNAKPMIHDDPLLRTYRDAAELYLRVVDMPPELQQRYLTTVCVGRDLLKFTIEELVRGDEADGARAAGEDARCVSADRVTATLVRFTDALNTAPAQPEVTAYVPGAYDSDRERTLAELVKLEQKFRWAARRPKPLEVYLREWPELRGPATVAELLRSECLTRAVYGSPASDRELSLRFPDLLLDDRPQRARETRADDRPGVVLGWIRCRTNRRPILDREEDRSGRHGHRLRGDRSPAREHGGSQDAAAHGPARAVPAEAGISNARGPRPSQPGRPLRAGLRRQ